MKKFRLSLDQHRVRDCPRRHAESYPRKKERHWNGVIVDSGTVHTTGETRYMVSFSHDLCKGKLIVDSGATSSVAGLRVCEDVYE